VSQAPPVDLDGALEPSARRRPHRVALPAALLAGLAIGATTAVGAHRPPPAGARQTLVTVRLRAVVMAERPTAVLALDLQDLGAEPLVAQDVQVSGAGLEPTTLALGRTLRPGLQDEVDLPAPLSCSRDRGAGTPVRAVVRLRPADVVQVPGGAMNGTPATSNGGAGSVPALPIDAAATPGGVCSAADTALPNGWLEPARSPGSTVGSDGVLHLRVEGLAADVSEVIGAQADSVLLPMPGAPVPVRAGGAALDLGVPAPTCSALAAGTVLPTGLQLLLAGGSGPRHSYLPVGTALAQWFGRAAARTCPDGPGGASTVRSGSAG
jgi:hypothetical protein